MTSHMHRYALTILAAASLAAGAAPAAQPPAAAAGATAIAQPAGAARIQRKALAQGLYEIVYSSRQDAVFVAAAGGFGEGAQAGRVLRLDPRTLAVQAEIPLERKGFGLVLDDAADRLYVGNTTEASITVIDVAAGKVVSTVQLADKARAGDGSERYPHNFRELVLDSANHRLYAPGLSFTGSALYVIDTRALKVEKVLPGLGFVATGVALDAARGRLFVSNLQGQVYTVDTRTLAVADKTRAEGDQLLNLAYDPATSRLFATDQGLERIAGMWQKFLPEYRPHGEGNQIVVLNADDGAAVRRLPVGEGPVALLLDDARQRLYVTSRGAGTVSVFDSASYALLDTIRLPSHPNSLALDRKNNVLYVTVKNGEGEPKGADESVVRIAL